MTSDTVRHCRPLLGTLVELTVPAGTGAAAVDAAYGAMRRVAALMSFHDAASELSTINRAGAGSVLRLDPWTHDVLTQARAVFDASGGAFDCAVGSRLQQWALLPRHAGTPMRRWSGRADLSALELRAGHQIVLRRPLCLDLGGIAKGYAVDKAVEALAAHGVRQAVVNAGGDLRVLGPAGQTIHVRHPAQPQQLLRLGTLADGAMATSAPYFSARRRGRAQVCALVAPATGQPLNRVASYTVLAPTCTLADALTKALAVGADPAAPYFAHFNATAILL